MRKQYWNWILLLSALGFCTTGMRSASANEYDEPSIGGYEAPQTYGVEGVQDGSQGYGSVAPQDPYYASFDDQINPEDARVREIIKQYLADQDAKKKAEEEAKKAAGYE